jgi:hypothetical protein
MAMLRVPAVVAITTFLSFAAAAQQPAPVPQQTARQALIEMITGGEKGFTKHLTPEVQQALNQKGKSQAASTMKLHSGAFASAGKGVQAFDGGSVLLSFAEPGGHSKIEVRVESDDLSGDEDNLGLSIHNFVDGQEQSAEWQALVSRFTVNMRRQEGLWRLNKVTIGVELSLGDPAFIEGILGKGAESTPAGMHVAKPIGHADGSGGSGERTPAAMMPQGVVAMLAVSESMFARQHPDSGFTCSLSDLAESATLFGVDPQVITGTYNGYRFALKGCEGKPAGSFQLTAEPVVPTPGAEAFCTDATQNLRTSQDGRGATCLTAGKVPDGHALGEDSVIGFSRVTGLATVEDKPKQ